MRILSPRLQLAKTKAVVMKSVGQLFGRPSSALISRISAFTLAIRMARRNEMRRSMRLATV